MTTNDYIKELKNHLSDLDNHKKNEIIKEIESYITESDVDYSLLIERFGTPKELAESYLEDIPIKECKSKIFWSKTKKIIFIIIVFLAVLSIIGGIVILAVILAILSIRKTRKNGGCSGGCSGCTQNSKCTAFKSMEELENKLSKK